MVSPRLVSDINQEIESLTSEGYRLDMIMPADDPHEAIMSRGGLNLRLVKRPASGRPVATARTSSGENDHPLEGRTPYALEWTRGRAGMKYRDLIPDRLGGRLIASHIRITEGGPVADYVHYHKINFQIIYCVAGWIRVVYEDQGPPFVLRPGDCVLQPPGIKHRVLEASAGAEVIEVSSPAVHETWIEHELNLPTHAVDPHRSFSGQAFVRHIAADAVWTHASEGCEARDLRLRRPSGGSLDASVIKTTGVGRIDLRADGDVFLFLLSGSCRLTNVNGEQSDLELGESVLIPALSPIKIDTSSGMMLLQFEILAV